MDKVVLLCQLPNVIDPGLSVSAQQFIGPLPVQEYLGMILFSKSHDAVRGVHAGGKKRFILCVDQMIQILCKVSPRWHHRMLLHSRSLYDFINIAALILRTPGIAG